MTKSERLTYGDSYFPQIATLLALHFKISVDEIKKATPEQDMQQATDLILPNGKTVANRIRQPQYEEQYGRQFTIRTSKGRDGRSEMDKIIAGYGDYLFYGFGGYEDKIGTWRLISLDAVRAAAKDDFKCCVFTDGCGFASAFMAFRIDGFLSYPPLIVASSDDKPVDTLDSSPCCYSLLQERIRRAALLPIALSSPSQTPPEQSKKESRG